MRGFDIGLCAQHSTEARICYQVDLEADDLSLL